MGVMPGAEPFAADGGDMGVVLSHGFTGSPRSLRPWAEHLAAAGLTVRLPRFVPSLAAIGDDIRKPGVTEGAYPRTPLKAAHSLSTLWPLVAADLWKITAPVLTYRSRVDHVVEPLSGRLLREGARSTEVTEVILEESYHVATLDHDAETVFTGSLEWVRRHPYAPAGS